MPQDYKFIFKRQSTRIRSAPGTWAPDHEPACFSHELRIPFGSSNCYFLEKLKDLRLLALLKIAGITPKTLAVLKLSTLGPERAIGNLAIWGESRPLVRNHANTTLRTVLPPLKSFIRRN